MPKDRRVNSSSFDHRVSPYHCSSKISDHKNSKRPLLDVGDEKEWEDIRCPICIEQPHNAVLLRCSSREKGCRPFICDTSYRHSNCLDQFRRSSAAANVFSLLEKKSDELVCPFCRGAVTGWDVMYPVRKFLDLKTRSCSLETCSFRGSYAELRKHARLEHPLERPSEISPTQKLNWTVQEQQREMEDVLIHQSDINYIHVPVFDMDIRFEWDDVFWSERNELPNLDNWADDDFWSADRFFDVPSGLSPYSPPQYSPIHMNPFSAPPYSPIEMTEVEEDSLLSGLPSPQYSGLPSPQYSPDPSPQYSPISFDEDLSVFSPYILSSHDEDMMDSGISRSRDHHVGNTTRSSESRSSSRNEDEAADALRSIADHPRDNDWLNLNSRSDYHRENGGTVSRNRPSSNASRSGHPRDNDWLNLGSRSDHRRETGRTVVSNRSSSNASRSRLRSRSRYERELTPEILARRWSYRWEDYDNVPYPNIDGLGD